MTRKQVVAEMIGQDLSSGYLSSVDVNLSLSTAPPLHLFGYDKAKNPSLKAVHTNCSRLEAWIMALNSSNIGLPAFPSSLTRVDRHLQ
uniref:Uncharacterized protein n=1 Tax=Utricularia reniformis TaxID=192314 RepID=A0A1Y0B2C9_9LAMI|nr:hypothetical protein AEK19_MT1348 [Utricularia reniformis]ART31547.1 hypothetical protein AEK19_MT1348 [Utricularia reniformis]